MKQVLLEGWRGISQSFAMVNQYHLIALSNRSDMNVYHRDLPFPNANWTAAANSPRFPPGLQMVIDNVPPPMGVHWMLCSALDGLLSRRQRQPKGL
jgi:hypothetical protein